MAEIIWTEPALQNLEDLAEYIALNNPAAAKKLVMNIVRSVDRLEEHPLSGRKPPELNQMDYREIIINPCRVFYKFTDQKIYILHIMRQERDLRRFLLSENRIE